MFSLGENNKFILHKCIKTHNEVYHHQNLLFGFGNSLNIESNCNLHDYNWATLGNDYESPFGFNAFSNEAETYLAGSYNF